MARVPWADADVSFMPQWLSRLTALDQRYFPVDGGGGADLFAALPALDDRLRQADAPAHADVLIVAPPLTDKLHAAVAETLRAMTEPLRILVLGESELRGGLGALEAQLRRVHIVALGAHASADSAADSAAALAWLARAEPEAVLVRLQELSTKEIATEEVVVNIGPVQQVTAGPLRLLLVCDGERVVRADVEADYAARGLAGQFASCSWTDALPLTELVDPLAPIAGRLAYVESVERLAELPIGAGVSERRAAALALERAASHLAWLVRFAGVLDFGALAAAARARLRDVSRHVPSPACVVLGGWQTASDADADQVMAVGQESPARDASATLRQLSKDVRDLGRRAERDRLLALRTRGIGVLTGQRALDAGLSGPNLRASQSGSGDVSARLLERLLRASHELASAASGLAILPPLGPPVMMPDQVPTGSAESYVEGPRGSLSFTVESDGGPHPTRVSWSRPSASALALVPELLRDCEIPDALLVLASLDLSTAEADG